MHADRRSFLLLWGVVLATAVGCCSDAPAPPIPADNADSQPLDPPSPPTAAEQVQQPAPPPSDAAAAVNLVLDGLSQDHPAALWDFLPESYQQDLTRLTHEFAAKTDAELWNGGFATLKKAANVLKTRKEFILNSSTLKQSVLASEQLSTIWDPTIEFFEALVHSDLADTEKLKSLDVGKFLRGTGKDALSRFRSLIAVSRIGTDPFQRWSGAKATLVSSDEQAATVLMEVPGEESVEEPFVKVDGKWIPQRMADHWPTLLQDANAKLDAASPGGDPQRRLQLLSLLEGLNGALDEMATATTQAEFDGAAAPLVFLLMAAQARPPTKSDASNGPAFPELPASGNGVKLILQGTVTDVVEDSLVKQLRAASDDPDRMEFESSRSDTMVTFELRPVTDVEAFAKKIEFGTVKSVDKAKRTITVDLKPVAPE